MLPGLILDLEEEICLFHGKKKKKKRNPPLCQDPAGNQKRLSKWSDRETKSFPINHYSWPWIHCCHPPPHHHHHHHCRQHHLSNGHSAETQCRQQRCQGSQACLCPVRLKCHQGDRKDRTSRTVICLRVATSSFTPAQFENKRKQLLVLDHVQDQVSIPSATWMTNAGVVHFQGRHAAVFAYRTYLTSSSSGVSCKLWINKTFPESAALLIFVKYSERRKYFIMPL